MTIRPKGKLFDALFLAFEAVMHIYLVFYLVSIKASLLSIGFTMFELIMFIRLLIRGRSMAQECYGGCKRVT